MQQQTFAQVTFEPYHKPTPREFAPWDLGRTKTRSDTVPVLPWLRASTRTCSINERRL